VEFYDNSATAMGFGYDACFKQLTKPYSTDNQPPQRPTSEVWLVQNLCWHHSCAAWRTLSILSITYLPQQQTGVTFT